MPRVCLTLGYDGAPFHGFAEQSSDVRTVAGDLRAVLEQMLRQPLRLTCAGRTDAGVHARRQVVTFDISDGTDTDLRSLTVRINKRLSPSIVVRSADFVAHDFDARFSADRRIYRYRVLNSEFADPLDSSTQWWVDQDLDVDAMNAAGEALLGEHDFSAYCRRPDPQASLVRRITRLGWTATDGEHLMFEIEATAFCHQMVRSIVGHLVDVGRNRVTVASVTAALESGDRNLAGPLAPPHGLVLWDVVYET